MLYSTPSNIGQRISRLVALSVIMAVLFIALVQMFLHSSEEIELRRSAIESTAFALASAAGEATVSNDRAAAAQALTAVARIPDMQMAAIQLSDGTTLASIGQVAFLSNDVFATGESQLELLLKGNLPVAVDIIKAGERRGRLIVVTDISSLRWHLFVNIVLTLATAFVAALLSVYASRPLQRRIVGPISRLTSAIMDIRSTRNYSTQLRHDGSSGETGILLDAFNGLMTDIQFRDKALQQLAYNDPLTGLANRVSFQRSLEDWLKIDHETPNGAIALLNIHSFRAMNDAFSHSIGDAILLTVAATIKSAIQENVTIARYGGDEFALLLPELQTTTDVEIAVSRIQAAFFAPLHIGDLSLHVSLNAGAVLLSDCAGEETSADEYLRMADLALAEAKRHTSGKLHFFKKSLSDEVVQDTELGQALRQAAKDGQFDLHFQPQLDLVANKVSGFEALLRWNHPSLGPISPAVFIPLAERIGLISVIGDWVLTEGCKQAAAWLKQNSVERMVSINVSPAQVLTAGFVEKVRSAMRKTGLPPRLLCLEVTESIFIGADYSNTLAVLETLRGDGVSLALDDFGTGYSSLSYLVKLPFHTIKIDRAFVKQADSDLRKQGMLKSITNMVHSLGMSVVAEGAETLGEMQILRSLGIDKMQGFALAKPMPAELALRRAHDIDSTLLAAA